MQRSPTEHSFQSLVRNTKEDYSRYQEIHAHSEEFYEKEVNHYTTRFPGKESNLNTTAEIPPPEPLSDTWYGNNKEHVYSSNLHQPELNLHSNNPQPYTQVYDNPEPIIGDYPQRDMSQFERLEQRNKPQHDSETESSINEPSAYRKKAFPQIKSQAIRTDSKYLDLRQPYDQNPNEDEIMTSQNQVVTSQIHVPQVRSQSQVTTPRQSEPEDVMFIPDEVQKALDVIGRYSNRFANHSDVNLADGSTVHFTPKRASTEARNRDFPDKRQSESMKRDRRQVMTSQRQSEARPERRSDTVLRPDRRHLVLQRTDGRQSSDGSSRPDRRSEGSLRPERRQTKSTPRFDQRQSVGSMRLDRPKERLDRAQPGRQSDGQYNQQKMNYRHRSQPSDPVLKVHPRHTRPAVEGRLKSGASSPFLYGSPVHSMDLESLSNSEYTNPYSMSESRMSESRMSEREKEYRSQQMNREDHNKQYLESFTSEYTDRKPRSIDVIADLMTSGELDVTSAADLQATLSDLDSVLGGLDEWMDTDVQDMAV